MILVYEQGPLIEKIQQCVDTGRTGKERERIAKCGFQPTADEEEWSEARQSFVVCRRFVLQRAAWQAALDLAS